MQTNMVSIDKLLPLLDLWINDTHTYTHKDKYRDRYV